MTQRPAPPAHLCCRPHLTGDFLRPGPFPSGPALPPQPPDPFPQPRPAHPPSLTSAPKPGASPAPPARETATEMRRDRRPPLPSRFGTWLRRGPQLGAFNLPRGELAHRRLGPVSSAQPLRRACSSHGATTTSVPRTGAGPHQVPEAPPAARLPYAGSMVWASLVHVAPGSAAGAAVPSSAGACPERA